jgi:hypothetical protein
VIAPVVWLLLANPVVIDGATSCPSPDAVARELGALLSADPVAREPDQAELVQEGAAGLRVELRRGDGSWVAGRTVATAQTCDQAAVAAAVVIAAWETDLGPRGPELTVDLGPRSPARGQAAAPPRPTPERPVLWRRSVPEAPRSQGGVVEIGAALGGSLSGGSVATSLLVDLTASGRDQPLGLKLSFEALSSHRSDLNPGPGSIAWHRFALAAGARYRVTAPGVFFDLHTSLEGALLEIQGDQIPTFSTPISVKKSTVDLGLGTGVRVGFGTPARGHVVPWIGLGVTFWSQNPSIETEATLVSIPEIEAVVHLGLLGGP